MAEGLARTIFGDTHTIESAGAEAAVGEPAAKHAVTALSELGADISNHRASQFVPGALGTFDTIVVIRPSAAESVPLPPSANVDFIDVQDPLGGSLDDYRKAARRIQLAVRELYATDVIRRLESPSPPAGSHLAGLYIRAARELEKELRALVATTPGLKVGPKSTLGTLAMALRKKGDPAHTNLAAAADKANSAWVALKHAVDPDLPMLKAGVHAIVQAYRLIAQLQ